MSRTYKDIRAAKYRKTSQSRWDHEYEKYEYVAVRPEYDFSCSPWKKIEEEYASHRWIKRAGVLPKQKRDTLDFQHLWYQSTPGWWTRTFMTAPKRRACRDWEKAAVKTSIESLEDLEICPDFGRKPHLYYW